MSNLISFHALVTSVDALAPLRSFELSLEEQELSGLLGDDDTCIDADSPTMAGVSRAFRNAATVA